MSEFPHLPIPTKISGQRRKKKGGGSTNSDSLTQRNKANRHTHGETLNRLVDSLSSSWKENVELRKNNGFPELSDPDIVPIFLRVDPETFNIESLRTFGIEIISEEENGYIIGSSTDNFRSLKSKIDKFLREEGKSKDQAAQLWEIVLGDVWRKEKILSKDLQEKWNLIQDNQEYFIDVGIACYTWLPDELTQNEGESDTTYETRKQRWFRKYESKFIERDELASQRQTKLSNFVNAHGGEIIDNEFVEFNDSFCCRIRINGRGLKDLTLNFQYLFEITEYNQLSAISSDDSFDDNTTLNLLVPNENAAKICVIDSGINEGHRLLQQSIITARSNSYIPNDTSTADLVVNGGHGTRVAGAVLYGNLIPRSGNYELPCWLFNAKILDQTNQLGFQFTFLPSVMEKILSDYSDASFFNLSVNENTPIYAPHMPQWAATIDKLIFEKNKLFIVSAGNVRKSEMLPSKGISEFINSGNRYPNYLLEKDCEITNPAHSSFALTVGSVCLNEFDNDIHSSFGKLNDPSSFSRTGFGMWGMIKPEVVEYGGDFVYEKTSVAPNINIALKPEIAPELVKTGMNLIGRDNIGTSFSTPKVSHIAAHLKNNYPSLSALMYKTLIVQSARLPNSFFENPAINAIRHYGYGIPTLERAIANNNNRITLIASDNLSFDQSNVYKIKIPREISRPGSEFSVLIEVTLSYHAEPRRTRRRTSSYLSTWMEWKASKNGEPYNLFCQRILQNIESDSESTLTSSDFPPFNWKIGEKSNIGIEGLRRNDSTTQKDWTIIPSNQLPDDFAIAVIARKGWEYKQNQEKPYSIAVSFELLENETGIDLYNALRVANEIELGSGEQEIRATQ